MHLSPIHIHKTLAVVIALVLGGVVGYLIGGSKTHPSLSNAPNQVNTSTEHTVASMLEELKDMRGEVLDAAFLDGMIVHHQQAIDLANIVLERTKRPEIKKMAADIIKVQTQEIETMQEWLKNWFGR